MHNIIVWRYFISLEHITVAMKGYAKYIFQTDGSPLNKWGHPVIYLGPSVIYLGTPT